MMFVFGYGWEVFGKCLRVLWGNAGRLVGECCKALGGKATLRPLNVDEPNKIFTKLRQGALRLATKSGKKGKKGEKGSEHSTAPLSYARLSTRLSYG